MKQLWFPGWGISPCWLAQQLSGLAPDSVDTFEVAPVCPKAQQQWITQSRTTESRWWCGWSLGGLQALVAAAEDSACQGVIVLAGTPCFRQLPDWPFAIESAALEAMQNRFQVSPDRVLKQFYRQITRGEPDRGASRHLLLQQCLPWAKKHVPELATALNFLATCDLRSLLQTITKPIYFLLGQQDSLLPFGSASALEALSPWVRVVSLPEVGHVPFGKRELLAKALGQCRPFEPPKPVAKAFGDAASGYGQASAAQRVAARCLVAQSPKGLLDQGGRILDMGCGTGFLGQVILQRFGEQVSLLCGVDVSAPMLTMARAHSPPDARQVFMHECLTKPELVATLPPWDVLVSNFAWHWLDEPLEQLSVWVSRLRSGGWLGLAIPIDGSLMALAKAWQSVDSYEHIHSFPEWRRLLDHLYGSPDITEVRHWEQTLYTEHKDVSALQQALRAIGAPLVTHKGRQGLLGKQGFKRLTQALDDVRSSRNGLPLAYRTGFLWAQKA